MQDTFEIKITNSRFNPIAEILTIGTCSAEYEVRKDMLLVYEFLNNEMHNGHFELALKWLETKGKEENKNLMVSDIVYPFFQAHLVNKRGFINYKGNSVIKYLKQ